MASRFARFCGLGAIVALVAAITLASPGAAQPTDAIRPGDFGAVRLVLDQIEATLRRDGLSVRALFDLGQALNPVRDELRGKIAELEPRLAQVDARLKQLGPAPAPNAPPENAAIAAERASLNAEYGELDAALKEARLLTARADQLADQITERRRTTSARQLLAQTQSVLSPLFWLEAASALPGELESLAALLQSWARVVASPNGLVRVALAALTLATLGIGLVVLWRWWRRRIAAPSGVPTRFDRALMSFGASLRIALTTPSAVAVVVAVLEGFDLLPDRLAEIAAGLVMAVAIAAFGRAVASGVLAPDEPSRRLVVLDDAAARTLSGHLVWATRILGALALTLVIHKTLAAPAVLTVAANMLFALAVGVLLLHLLVSSRQSDGDAAGDGVPRRLWVRAVAWLVLLVVTVALLTGYAGLAAFIAERLISTVAVFGALYLLLGLVNAGFSHVLTADTPRGRTVAVNLGVNPRRLGLVATMLSGGVSVLLMLVALILVIGPWEVTAADFIDALRNATFVFHIGEFSVSLTAIVSAAAILLLALVITRALQGWLENRLLPQTELEPSSQQSIAAIFGYVGVITAIVLTLSQLGIDLQKVALIAGALSVGIGFGLQSIVSNFVSGLILLAERPIRVGDRIVVKGEEGYVRRIRVRATEIETFDRASVIVPNAEFISGAVKNWTHVDRTGRVLIKLGVAYDTDPNQVRDILEGCAREHPNVLAIPAPSAQLAGFGDSALEFELIAFVADIDAAGHVRSDLNFAILRRFRAAGIEIPYPQREVRLRGGASTPAAGTS
jgi:potassium efflux system protein